MGPRFYWGPGIWSGRIRGAHALPPPLFFWPITSVFFSHRTPAFDRTPSRCQPVIDWIAHFGPCETPQNSPKLWMMGVIGVDGACSPPRWNRLFGFFSKNFPQFSKILTKRANCSQNFLWVYVIFRKKIFMMCGLIRTHVSGLIGSERKTTLSLITKRSRTRSRNGRFST